MNVSIRVPVAAATARKFALASAWLSISMVSACASFGPDRLPPGSSREQVIQALGPPTGIFELRQPLEESPDLRIDPTGTANKRLEYRGGSFSRVTYMFDFDANDRLLASAQVLSESRFNAIRAGMDQQEVARALGRPSTIWKLGFQSQNVWAYRFEGPFCQWFQVGVGYDGKVVDTAYGPDPLCEPLFEPSL